MCHDWHTAWSSDMGYWLLLYQRYRAIDSHFVVDIISHHEHDPIRNRGTRNRPHNHIHGLPRSPVFTYHGTQWGRCNGPWRFRRIQNLPRTCWLNYRGRMHSGRQRVFSKRQWPDCWQVQLVCLLCVCTFVPLTDGRRTYNMALVQENNMTKKHFIALANGRWLERPYRGK